MPQFSANSLLHSNRISAQTISLPTFIDLQNDEIEIICHNLIESIRDIL